MWLKTTNNEIVNGTQIKLFYLAPQSEGEIKKDLYNLAGQFPDGKEVNFIESISSQLGNKLISDFWYILQRNNFSHQFPLDLGSWAIQNAPESPEATQEANRRSEEKAQEKARQDEMKAAMIRKQLQDHEQQMKADQERLSKLVDTRANRGF